MTLYLERLLAELRVLVRLNSVPSQYRCSSGAFVMSFLLSETSHLWFGEGGVWWPWQVCAPLLLGAQGSVVPVVRSEDLEARAQSDTLEGVLLSPLGCHLAVSFSPCPGVTWGGAEEGGLGMFGQEMRNTGRGKWQPLDTLGIHWSPWSARCPVFTQTLCLAPADRRVEQGSEALGARAWHSILS